MRNFSKKSSFFFVLGAIVSVGIISFAFRSSSSAPESQGRGDALSSDLLEEKPARFLKLGDDTNVRWWCESCTDDSDCCCQDIPYICAFGRCLQQLDLDNNEGAPPCECDNDDMCADPLTCIDGTCKCSNAGDLGCPCIIDDTCDDQFECREGVCKEVKWWCESCTDDSDCCCQDVPYICHENRCVQQLDLDNNKGVPPCCENDDMCADPLTCIDGSCQCPYADSIGCPCINDDMCGNSSECRDGTCQEVKWWCESCTDDSDCCCQDVPYICHENRCVQQLDLDNNEGVPPCPCTDDRMCGYGSICDLHVGTCKKSECTGFNDGCDYGSFCLIGRCQPCNSSGTFGCPCPCAGRLKCKQGFCDWADNDYDE